MKRKAPRGLKANKKTKVDDGDDMAATSAAAEIPAEEKVATMTVQLADDGEDLDEIGELKQLYASAHEKLAEEHEDGKLLIQGVVHECDRILRVSSKSETDRAKGGLPWDFFLIYGLALYRLALVIRDAEGEAEEDGAAFTEACDFLDAAVDRFNNGVEALEAEVEKKTEGNWTLHEAIGRVRMEKANMLVRHKQTEGDGESGVDDEIEELRHDTVRHLQKAIDALPEDERGELVGIADIVVRHMELAGNGDPQAGKAELEAAASKWLKGYVAKHKEDPAGLKKLGDVYMLSAGGMLEQMDTGDEVDKVLLKKKLEDALEYFEKAHKLAHKDEDVNVPLLLSLGECYINRANLLDEEDQSEAADGNYRKAFDLFKKVEANDASALPDQFGEFLKSWEKDFPEGK
ncbi:inhibitor of Brome mosaic virus [Irineochytrium annulatum]|nr:inhibitor of Brome mosaic virus [Irineochytrium annulatum]